MTLHTLTDRDLLLNLWLTVLMLAEGFDLETDQCEQSLLRDGQDPDPTAPSISLSDLLAEVESRLGLSGGLDGFKQGRRN